MSLYERLDADIKEAMKAKDKDKLEILRLLKSAVKDIMINEKKDITDEIVIGVVTKSIKQRRDSIESFVNGGREDLVAKEEAGVKILSAYLPEQLSEDELRKVISNALNEAGLSKKEELGAAMKAIMPKVKGKAEGKLINKIVSDILK